MPLTEDGKVEEGLVVLSRSGEIEGRTTGARSRCTSIGCPGWFVAVTWETGQALKPCSEGWTYDADTKTIRLTGGGEISARTIAPPPAGVDPFPRDQWPARPALSKRQGCRIHPGAPSPPSPPPPSQADDTPPPCFSTRSEDAPLGKRGGRTGS